MIAIDIVVEAEGWRDLPDLDGLARRAVDAAFAQSGEPDDDLAATILFADDAAVRALNRDWRAQDKPTNVLSFPSALPAPPGEPHHLGDVALAYETVRREAADEGKSVVDHAAHLVVHGILHLLGQDHDDDREADRMEAAEIRALASLGIADPYRPTDS